MESSLPWRRCFTQTFPGGIRSDVASSRCILQRKRNGIVDGLVSSLPGRLVFKRHVHRNVCKAEGRRRGLGSGARREAMHRCCLGAGAAFRTRRRTRGLNNRHGLGREASQQAGRRRNLGNPSATRKRGCQRRVGFRGRTRASPNRGLPLRWPRRSPKPSLCDASSGAPLPRRCRWPRPGLCVALSGAPLPRSLAPVRRLVESSAAKAAPVLHGASPAVEAPLPSASPVGSSVAKAAPLPGAPD